MRERSSARNLTAAGAVCLTTAALMLVCASSAVATRIKVTETVETATFAPANADGTPQADSIITGRANDNTECSLREAITAANRNEPVGGCNAGQASEQDVIVVPSGTYTAWDHFTITEPVTIRGANTEHPGNSGNRDPESEIRLRYNPNPAAQQGLFFILGAAGGSRFNGLELTGAYDTKFCPTNPSQCEAAAIVQVRPGVSKSQGQTLPAGFHLRNSIVQQWTFGLYVSGDEPQIRFNLFRDNDRPPQGPNIGVDVYADFIHPLQNPIITDNVFAGPLRYAIVLQGLPPDYTAVVGATIRRNLIHKSANRSGAIIVFGMRDVVIDQNVLTGENLSAPFAIWLDRVDNVKIRENSITGFGGALTIIDSYFGPPSVVGVKMHNNRLYGNGAGVQVGPPYTSPTAAPLAVDATANWWGANGGAGATGARPGAPNPVNGVRTLNADGDPIADGPVAGVNTSNPLTLTCSMPESVTVNTPVSLTGAVTGMPAFDRDASELPWLEEVREPVMAAGITGVTGDVFGFGKPPVGGSLTGTLVPSTAGSGAGTVAVDSEQAACAFTAAPEDIDVDKAALTSPAVPGGLMRYRITVHNRGQAPVRRLRVCDRFPRALRFVRASLRMTRVSGRRVCRKLQVLGAGGSQTLRLTFRLRADTTADVITNTGTADTANSNNNNTRNDGSRDVHGSAVEAASVRHRATACPASGHPVANIAC
jgi:CSLREA domain-containing protein/uncharacterized repeat protein (TIGR01451 family)